jgi:hypothetical protein
MKLQTPLLVGLIVLFGAVSSNQSGQPQAEGQLAALERSASPQWAVDLSLKPDTVAVGNLDMAVSIRSARSGYLTLLQRGTDGKEDIVFPNALDKDNRIEADKPVVLPRESWKWKAAPPAGEGRLLAVVSDKPVDTQSLSASLNGQTYGAASAAYRERD